MHSIATQTSRYVVLLGHLRPHIHAVMLQFGVALVLVVMHVVWGLCRACAGEGDRDDDRGSEHKHKDVGDKAVSLTGGQVDAQAPSAPVPKSKDLADRCDKETSASTANGAAPLLPENRREARVDLVMSGVVVVVGGGGGGDGDGGSGDGGDIYDSQYHNDDTPTSRQVFMLFFCIALLLLAMYVKRLAVVTVPILGAFASGVLYRRVTGLVVQVLGFLVSSYVRMIFGFCTLILNFFSGSGSLGS